MANEVNTAKVTGRRELRFESLDEVLADAESLASGPWQQSGNWSLGQITKHLAISFENTADGREFKAPWFVRLVMPFFKKSFIEKPLSPGFKMPEAMKPVYAPPAQVETDEGLAALRAAIDHFNATKELPPRSTILGKMSREDWVQFQLRHSEMHLSFIVPQT